MRQTSCSPSFSSARRLSAQNHAAAIKRRRRRRQRALVEALDRRVLLSVSFKFNIIDPTNQFKNIKPQLTNLLNAAGGEWASHLDVPTRDVTLEYDIGFSNDAPPATATFTGFSIQLLSGAAKSAQVIGTDTGTVTNTGKDVYRLGTITEMVTGADPNGAKADAGLTIYVPYLKYWYYDPHLNSRTDPIPAGQIDAYSAVLHEMGHTLGMTSARDIGGNLSGNAMYTYDQHVNSFGSFVQNPNGSFTFNFGGFGNGTETFDPLTQQFVVDPSSDNAFKVYGSSVPLQFENFAELGQGRPTDAFLANQDISLDFFLQQQDRYFDDLSTDLMGGLVDAGERKNVTKLDLAILKDSGVPVRLNVDPNPQGILEIDGTGDSDTIDLSLTNGTLLVRVNDAVQSYNSTQSQAITGIVVNGLGGNDNIFIHGDAPSLAVNGGAGNDTIIGGPKGDSITGAGGNDLIYGGKGGDVIRGGDGKDTIYGQGGSDRLLGDASNDHLDGGAQNDRISGGSGADTLVGGTEDDFLFGESGNDVLSGAGGKDRMDGGGGADAFYGGNGNDLADYSGRVDQGIVATIDGSPDDGAPNEGDNIQQDVENVFGTPFGDVIVGSDGPNSLIGGGGNDTIDGGGNADTLEGNAGNDSLIGSGGNDSLVGGSGNDHMIGGAGRDHFLGEDGDDTIVANDNEVDTLDGGAAGNDNATVDAADILNEIELPTIV